MGKIKITITRIQDLFGNSIRENKHGQRRKVHYIKSKELQYIMLELTRLNLRVYLY